MSDYTAGHNSIPAPSFGGMAIPPSALAPYEPQSTLEMGVNFIAELLAMQRSRVAQFDPATALENDELYIRFHKEREIPKPNNPLPSYLELKSYSVGDMVSIPELGRVHQIQCEAEKMLILDDSYDYMQDRDMRMQALMASRIPLLDRRFAFSYDYSVPERFKLPVKEDVKPKTNWIQKIIGRLKK